MKPETYVAIGLFILFITATIVNLELMRDVLYYLGCFAVGWNIPNVSKFLVNYWRTYVTKRTART